MIRNALVDARHRVNRLPLGRRSARRNLVSGSTGRQWRNHSALKGFAAIRATRVSDRDFAIEFLAAASLIMIHVSRLSEELILWMNPRFAFIDLPDRFCTGSSIMPQKKNPDVPELARGKTGRVAGHLVGVLMLMKAQPLAYNKDNQEDKEPLFDTIDTVLATLRIFTDLIAGIVVKPDAHATRRQRRLCHCHRSGRLPGAGRPAVPRCPRGLGQGRQDLRRTRHQLVRTDRR